MSAPTLPFEGIVLGRYSHHRNTDVPRGCVVYEDAKGFSWVVWAPQMVEAMRAECPHCDAS